MAWLEVRAPQAWLHVLGGWGERVYSIWKNRHPEPVYALV
jgi:hypothetical protein